MADKVQKIRNEVERLQNELIQEKKKGFGSDADDACILELQNVLTYIDSLQEEPVISNVNVEPIGVPAGVVELANVPDRKECSVSEELEKAAKDYARFDDYYDNKEYDGFKAGAKWDRQRTINKACEWLDKYASDFVALADDSHPAIGDTQAFYGTKSLLHYFRQEMED